MNVDQDVAEMRQVRAIDYLPKTGPMENLVAAVYAAAKNGLFASDSAP